MSTLKPKKDPRPCTTIFSDASLFPDGAAGWGASILAGEVKVEHGAPFRVAVADPLDAEVRAAANALHLAAARGLLAGGPIVVLQIDSTDAIGVILGSDARHRYSPGPHGRDRDVVRQISVPARCVDAVAAIRRVCVEYKATLYLRHVKGHRPRLSGRHKMNERANDLARAAAQGTSA
jgi:ribonuclease HI